MDPITIGIALATQFAPAIVKYFTNSDTAAAVAGQVIGIAKTVTGRDDPVAAQAVLAADPALAMQFQTLVMANETELQKLYLADVQSARAREVALAQSGVKGNRANIMAGAALLFVLIGLVAVIWNTDMDDFAKATVTLIIGRALGWVEQIYSYEFGSTRTSRTKDDTINQLTK